MPYRLCSECAAVHQTDEAKHPTWQCARCFCFQASAAVEKVPDSVTIVNPADDELRYAIQHGAGFVFPVFRQGEARAVAGGVTWNRPADSTVIYISYAQADRLTHKQA